MRPLVISLLTLLCAFPLAAQNCRAYFTVVQKDQLNNIQQGLQGDTKWIYKDTFKKYQGVCYVPPTFRPQPKLVFYITVSTSTYHGTRTESDTQSAPVTATVTDQNGNISTVNGTTDVTTSETVPYSFDYPVYTLSIETETADGKWTVVHNLRRRGTCPALAGLCMKNRHPERGVIEEGMSWIHQGGLSDQLQSVLGQEKK